jgi:hypothetical protein
MSTAEVVHPSPRLPGETTELDSQRVRGLSLPVAVAAALLALILYAVFDHGAVALPVEARIQVVVAAVAAVAGAGWLWTGTIRLAAPRLAIAGGVLLTAFAVWSGVTVLWSVAPDQTWIELNRALAYVIVLCLGTAVGASHPRAVDLIARWFLWIVFAVTLYAIGQKLIPGVHVGGLFSLNQTGPLPRLQEPLGYWNALALFVAMGVPLALALAVDRNRSSAVRTAAAIAIEPMLLVIAFTYSRGGLLALVMGLAIGLSVSGARLRSLLWLAVAVLATIPPLVFGLVNHSLTTAGVSLGHREAAGGELAGILLVSLLALGVAVRNLLALEQRVRMSPARARGIGHLLVAGIGVALVALVVAVSVSSRGLDGTVSHAWKQFTTTRAISNYDPHRLLSADSENRWVWWKEAAGALSARPLAGWGAGSFGVVHLLYRRDTLTVKQPHSVPLQFLVETGIIGALLAIGAFALLLGAAVRSVRSRVRGPERLLAAALLAAAAAYAVHALYDWDWDIPAMTLPALLFLGMLAGIATRKEPGVGELQGGPPGPKITEPRLRPAPVTRLLWLGALTLWLCSFALSAALPSIAASKANSALVRAASTSPAALKHAQATAALASSLDPLSDAGLLAEATIALHQNDLTRARSYSSEAVQRDPTDGQAWSQLWFDDLAAHDFSGANQAISKVLALDPFGGAHTQLQLAVTSARQSATATSTPLR